MHGKECDSNLKYKSWEWGHKVNLYQIHVLVIHKKHTS